MKDRRTKAELAEANESLMDKLSRAQNQISDLEAALRSTKAQLESTERERTSWAKEAQELRAEKSKVYNRDWADSRTREHEYVNGWNFAERRAGILRGALIVAVGREKADEVDPGQGPSPC